MRQPEDELDALKQASLLRRLPLAHDWAHDWANQDLINFASNDYLGLAHHRQIQAAYQDAIEKYGSGSTASRLICGTQPPHQELESLLAEAKGTEAALSFSTGYATSLGVLTALLKKGDTVILDKLCHASLIDGARLSGATIRVYPHNRLSKLESLLASTEKKATTDTRTLVVTESVFSMDGDVAPLQEIAQLTRRYHSLLMVDEAHALGVHGATGMGLAEELNIQGDIDFHMGTLGKAAGVGGGYLAAKQVWIDLLVNRARSFIYSTAPPPAQAAAAAEAIRLIRSEEGKRLRAQLWKNIHTFRHIFHDTAQINGDASSAIIPWMVGDSNAALDLSAQLRDHGMLVPAIRYPTVPPNTARLRITLSATHQEEEIVKLAKLIA
jgi:8-amino-7-oxononanoate synthase